MKVLSTLIVISLGIVNAAVGHGYGGFQQAPLYQGLSESNLNLNLGSSGVSGGFGSSGSFGGYGSSYQQQQPLMSEYSGSGFGSGSELQSSSGGFGSGGYGTSGGFDQSALMDKMKYKMNLGQERLSGQSGFGLSGQGLGFSGSGMGFEQQEQQQQQQPLLQSYEQSYQQPSFQMQQPLLQTYQQQQPLLQAYQTYQQPLLQSFQAPLFQQTWQQPLLQTFQQQPVFKLKHKQQPIRTYSTVNNAAIVQAPIYEQLPTVTNPMQGVMSQPIAAANVVNAAIVRPTTLQTNAVHTKQTTGVGSAALGSTYNAAIVQQPIYEQLPTVTNPMQGTKSQPLARAAVMNAAIVRPALLRTNGAHTKQTTGAGVAALGSSYNAAIVQQPIYEQLATVTNPMQGVMSSPVSAPNVMNAAIVRPTITENWATQVEQTQSQPILAQQPVFASSKQQQQ